MKAHSIFVAASLFLFVGMAHAQVVEQVALTTYDSETEGDRSTDAALGVHDDGIVITTNMRVSLFSKSGGSPLQTYQVGDSGFPFKMYDPSDGRFFDPRVDYDPINNRLWMFYSEDNVQLGDDTRARLHLALTKNPAIFPAGSSAITSLSSGHWWYFTGNATASPATVRDGEPFDFSADMRKYLGTLDPDLHEPYETLVDLPSMSFDERALILTPYSIWDVGSVDSNSIVIIPFEHEGASGTESILDGQRPDEEDITHIRLIDLDDISIGGEEDRAVRYFAVPEPYEQVENATFFINAPDSQVLSEEGKYPGVRLSGLYYDDDPGVEDWIFQQFVISSTLTDMDLPGITYDYHRDSSSGADPLTPLATWRPNARENVFHQSAVLAPTANNTFRIFAAHNVFDDVGGTADNEWIIQWYVIDPDLSGFRSASWEPEILIAGRIDTAGTGDHYHPVIGVTRQGVAVIEYTYSDGNDFPQVRRATLNSSYTAVASDVLVQPGPELGYLQPIGGWCDFADMQADPTDCTLWSVHTLVYDDEDPPVTDFTDARSVWLFELDGGCNNANLNGDGGVDLLDMALFNSYYATGARRVDMNTDGTTDETDAALYDAAYDAATSP